MSVTETPQFTIPDVALGDTVAYYPHAVATTDPIIGHVKKLNARSIDIILASEANKIVRGVRNVNDPELISNPHWRAAGAWDMCGQYKRLETRITLLAARVSVLENGQQRAKTRVSHNEE